MQREAVRAPPYLGVVADEHVGHGVRDGMRHLVHGRRGLVGGGAEDVEGQRRFVLGDDFVGEFGHDAPDDVIDVARLALRELRIGGGARE